VSFCLVSQRIGLRHTSTSLAGREYEAQKMLLGLQLGSRGILADWLDFVRDVAARGVRCLCVGRRAITARPSTALQLSVF
jgi:hypothetical protein